MIQIKDGYLKENQDTKVTLLHYPDFEITEVGHLGNEYLFLSGQTSQSLETILLLPVEPISIRIDIVERHDVLSAKSKQKIGFRGDISDSL